MDTLNNIDKFPRHNVEQQKSDTKEYILYESIYEVQIRQN